MRIYRHPLIVVALLISLFVTTGLSQAGTLAQPQLARIRLKAATFTAGQEPVLPAALRDGAEVAGLNRYYLVQSRGPVTQAWKAEVAKLGAELLDYIPDYAFKVRMTPAVAQQVRQLADVAWVGRFHPAYKLSPTLKRDGMRLYKVQIERGADAGAAGAAIAASGAQVLGGQASTLLVAADAAQLDAVAQVLDVAWVENFILPEKHNEYGGSGIIGGAVARSRGYNGSTQIAAVSDTGLGGGTAATAHPDIPASRIVAIRNWPGTAGGCFRTIVNDGAKDVDSGHGTHTAGSVLSDGGVSGEGIGVAPAARLVFQATENYATITPICTALNPELVNGYYLTGIPDDLRTHFQQAYDDGARIHSNSWGSDVAGDYTADSAYADEFVWGHRDMIITFSAGNEGADANANGVVDNDSIGSPATAKNVLTVGASENDRQGHYECDPALTYTSHDTTYQNGQTCASMGGQNFLGTPGQRWGFTAPPISTDLTAGNAEQMAAFSSRGPTDDGRIKPDVVAPGTWVLSTYSGEYQEGYGDPVNPQNGLYQSDGWGIGLNSQYKYFGGTSMSNPLTAGAATVVRDFYQKAHSLNASAALVKATLINSAVDLLDENNDGANDNDFPIPNVHEGWGRVNLDNATDGTAQFVDNTAGLSTGGSAAPTYTAPGGAPLKITLVWSDYPSTEAAAANLVNNLNLTVTGPGGVTYRGNVFSGGWSATGGSADTVNNVENVYVQSAAAGTWTVTVNGANVPNGPQPFALVVDGAATTPPPPPPAAPSGLSATAISSSQINLAWTDNASNEDGFKIERCQGAGCSSFAEIGTVGANVTTFPSTGLTASTSYSYRVRAYNAGGNSAYSNTASATTLGGPSNTGLLSPSANAAVTSNAGDNNGFQTNPNNGHANDGVFAVDTNSGTNTNTSCTNNGKDKHIYRDYNVSLPGGATINGIEVRLDARVDATGGQPRMCVQLSWDGGASWTTAKTTATNLTTSEATYTLGGAADTWGRTWATGDLTNANFRVRIINRSSNANRDFSLDWVAVQVTYQ
jgi:hypothetical protein